jgi:hypothetical protein
MKTTDIIDSAGRRGIITERREGGVFARPAEMPASVEFTRGARLTTATFWAYQPDGSLRGIWCDSRTHGFTTANLA